METALTSVELGRDWLAAKTDEDTAKARRIKVEEALVAALGAKAEGSKTHDLGEFKVTLTGNLLRTLNKEVWESIKDKLPQEIRPVTYEPTLDVTGVKWLLEHHPEDYKVLAQALTIKPGKTSIKVVAANK